MALAMFIKAINGAVAAVAATPGKWPKAKLAALLTYLSLKEVLGFGLMLPSLSRSLLLYSLLPSHRPAAIASGRRRRMALPALTYWPWLGGFNVSVVRNIPYGRARRNLLDVYIPNDVADNQGRNGPQKWPAVMFVHGGIWATGSKELFSHLGASLADAGVLTLIVQYTLFPEVLASTQAREVSSALTWLFNNAEEYGADLQKLTLMGHSSGAHLCALVLWERYMASHRWQRNHTSVACGLSYLPQADIHEADVADQDLRQPHNFVGMAGVYDVVGHLQHERKRGVDSLSCMTPAMGGKDCLEAMSPVHLFRSSTASGRSAETGIDDGGTRTSRYDAIAHNVDDFEFMNKRSCKAAIMGDGCNNVGHPVVAMSQSDADVGSVVVGSSSEGDFPRCSLLCSWGDTVVPPNSSIALNTVLQENVGHQSTEVLVFNNLTHSDFIKFGGLSPEQVMLQKHILRVLQL